METKINNRISLLAIIQLGVLVGCTSCVKDVILDAKEKALVAVGCVLTDEPIQTLYLSFTKGASLDTAPPLTEASVTLYDEGDKIGGFQRSQNNKWVLSYAANPGHHYRLEIVVPGYGLIWAEQTMPAPLRIASYGDFPYRIEGLHYPSIVPEMEFVPNAEDFESLPLGTKVYFIPDLPNTVWLFAMNYDSESGQHCVVENICTDCQLVDPFNITGETYIPLRRTDIPNPFVPGSTVSELHPQLTNQPLHRRYLRFPAQDLSQYKGWLFTIAGDMRGKYNCKDFYQLYYGDYGFADSMQPDEGYVEAVSVSLDLDTYLVSAYHQKMIAESTDLATIYLRDNLPTNISGGIGVFGAMCTQRYQWSGEYEYVDDGIEHKIYVGPANENSTLPVVPYKTDLE